METAIWVLWALGVTGPSGSAGCEVLVRGSMTVTIPVILDNRNQCRNTSINAFMNTYVYTCSFQIFTNMYIHYRTSIGFFSKVC